MWLFVCPVVIVRTVLDFQALNLVIEYTDISNQNETESCSVMPDSLRPHGLCSPWNSPGQSTGVGSLSLLQGIFATLELNPGLPHCRQILYQLSYQGSPVTKISKKKKKKKEKKEICFKRMIMLQLMGPLDILLVWKLCTVLNYAPPQKKKVSGILFNYIQ